MWQSGYTCQVSESLRDDETTEHYEREAERVREKYEPDETV